MKRIIKKMRILDTKNYILNFNKKAYNKYKKKKKNILRGVIL